MNNEYSSVPVSEPKDTISSVTDNNLRQRSQDLGVMGKLFGSTENAPINIAGLVIFLCIIGIVIGEVLPSSPNFSQGDQAKTLGGLALAALTFLGGYLGGNKKGK